MKKKEGPLTREDKLRAVRTLLQLVIDSEHRASGAHATPHDAGSALDDDGFLEKCARSLVARARAGERQLIGVEFGTAYAEILAVAQGLPQKLRAKKARNDAEGVLSRAARQVLVGVRAITHEAIRGAATPVWARELIDDVSPRDQGDRAIENAVARRLKSLLTLVPEPKPSWETIISVRAVERDKGARPGSAIQTKAHMQHVREKTLSVRVPPVAESLVLALEACEAPERLQNLVMEAISKWREEAVASLRANSASTAEK